MEGNTKPINMTVSGANHDIEPQAWTCVKWFGKISSAVSSRTNAFFGRVVAAFSCPFIFIPSLCVDGYKYAKRLTSRKISTTNEPVVCNVCPPKKNVSPNSKEKITTQKSPLVYPTQTPQESISTAEKNAGSENLSVESRQLQPSLPEQEGAATQLGDRSVNSSKISTTNEPVVCNVCPPKKNVSPNSKEKITTQKSPLLYPTQTPQESISTAEKNAGSENLSVENRQLLPSLPEQEAAAKQLDDRSVNFLKNLSKIYHDNDKKNKGFIRDSDFCISYGRDGIVLKLTLKNGQNVIGKIPRNENAKNLLNLRDDLPAFDDIDRAQNALLRSITVKTKLKRVVEITNHPSEISYQISYSEYFPGTVFGRRMGNKNDLLFDPVNIKEFAHELLNEYEQLWNAGYLHLDMHAGNIIVTDDNKPRIIDFGCVKDIQADCVSRELMCFGHILLTLALKNEKKIVEPYDPKGKSYSMTRTLPSGESSQFLGYRLEDNPEIQSFIFEDKNDGYDDLRSLLKWLFTAENVSSVDSLKKLKNHSYFKE